MCEEEQANFFKCFSHRSRVRLARLLVEDDGEKSVTELAEGLDMTHSAASRHLNILKLQGLVDVRREDQRRYYSLNLESMRNKFQEFLKYLHNDKS